jgi:predicted DNA-binding protein
MRYSIRHYLRVDPATQNGLETLTRYTCMTKSQLMRRFVQEGVRKEIEECENQMLDLQRKTDALSRFQY